MVKRRRSRVTGALLRKHDLASGLASEHAAGDRVAAAVPPGDGNNGPAEGQEQRPPPKQS